MPRQLKPVVVTQREAADMLKVSPSTIDRLIARRALPTVRVRRRVLIPYSAIEDFRKGGNPGQALLAPPPETTEADSPAPAARKPFPSFEQHMRMLDEIIRNSNPDPVEHDDRYYEIVRDGRKAFDDGFCRPVCQPKDVGIATDSGRRYCEECGREILGPDADPHRKEHGQE